MTTEEKFTFFFGHDSSKHGDSAIFSNWFPVSFYEYENDGDEDDEGTKIVYGNTEQYMMAKKALLFGDHAMYQKIMANPDPKKCKALGRKVKNFDQKIWSDNCKSIVKRGIMLKFTQNPDLLKVLMSTAGTTLVEASPYDRIWGIGLRATSPLAQTRATWKGSNLLGEILTEVRNKLR